MKEIKVTLIIEVPNEATDQDITDFVDVEYAGCNGMKLDNPVRLHNHKEGVEVIEHKSKRES